MMSPHAATSGAWQGREGKGLGSQEAWRTLVVRRWLWVAESKTVFFGLDGSGLGEELGPGRS